MATFDKQKFGLRLNEMRLKAGYKRQIDLAEKLGTVVQTISNYESGNRLPDAEMLSRIVEVLPCNADYLLGFEDKPTYSEAYITEFTGLQSEAIALLNANQLNKTNIEEKGDIFSDVISLLITSDQFQKMVKLHEDCEIFCQVQTILQHCSDADEPDDLDRIMMGLSGGKTNLIGKKARFDLYIAAAKYKAMELYGSFFDSVTKDARCIVTFVNESDGSEVELIKNGEH